MKNTAVLIGCLAVLGFTDVAIATPAVPERVELAQAPRPLVSGERVRVKKLARDMESAMQTLNQGGVTPFQDPTYADKWRKSVERYRAAVQKFPQVDDPDVQAAAAKLAELEKHGGLRRAIRRQAAIGTRRCPKDPCDHRTEPARQPRAAMAAASRLPSRKPATGIKVAADSQQTAKKAVAELQRIAPTAHLPVNRGTVQSGAPYDKQDLDRLLRFANGNLKDVDSALKQTLDALKTQFAAQDRELAYYRELDPDNEKHRMNAFLKEGAKADIYAGLDRHLALAQSVTGYQRAFAKAPTPRSLARIDEIITLRKTYAANRFKSARRIETARSQKQRCRTARHRRTDPCQATL